MAQAAPPPTYSWIGLAIVLFSGIDIGLALLLGVRDLYDGTKRRLPILVAYAFSRVAVALLMFPILRLLLQGNSFKHVPWSWDAGIYVVALALYGASLVFILKRYWLVRQALADVLVLSTQDGKMASVQRKRRKKEG